MIKVEFDADEVWALLSTLLKQVIDEAGLADEDRAAMRRWRTQQMRPGSEEMKALVQKLNEDIARLAKQRSRSPIQKHDWV
jgi:hypothetical protein